MRGIRIATVVLGAFAGCVAERASVARRAATPSEAFMRMIDATADADEAAYQDAVICRSPTEYAEAERRSRFAATRLRRAIADRGIAVARSGSARFDPDQELILPAEPSEAEWARQRDWLATLPWTIDGDVATPISAADVPPDELPRAERSDGGWRMIITDRAIDAAAGKALKEAADVMAAIYEDAAIRVRDGRLTSVRAINDFVVASQNAVSERATAALLAAPPTGPTVVVTDAESGRPVASATVWAQLLVPPTRLKTLPFTTDGDGRVRLPVEPNDRTYTKVYAEGYATMSGIERRFAEGSGPESIHLVIARPVLVETTLVLPDERRRTFSVDEGEILPATPGLRERFAGVTRTLTIEFEAEADQAESELNPLRRVRIPPSPPRDATTQDAAGAAQLSYRVTAARTAHGRALPVFRDAPPADSQTFGLYLIGHNGFGDGVFVVGTLDDARRSADAAEADAFRWSRNSRVLGAAPPSPTTAPAD